MNKYGLTEKLNVLEPKITQKIVANNEYFSNLKNEIQQQFNKCIQQQPGGIDQ